MVQRFDRLRHDTVVSGDHEHRDVGHLRTTRTHGGERFVTRGVDERDRPLAGNRVSDDLVRTDVLRDATVLASNDVGVANRVEQLGLAVVDVTHDGDNRRAGTEIALVAFVLAELEVERLEQLAVFVLGADHLHVVAEFGAEQLQGLFVHRLGSRDHLAEMEHDLHERRGIRANAVGEVGQRRATRQPQNLAVAARYLHAADRRGLHVVELLTPLLLRLAAASRPATGASTERTRGATAAPTATRTWATARTCARGAATGSHRHPDHHGQHLDHRGEQEQIPRARPPDLPAGQRRVRPHLGRAFRIHQRPPVPAPPKPPDAGRGGIMPGDGRLPKLPAPDGRGGMPGRVGAAAPGPATGPAAGRGGAEACEVKGLLPIRGGPEVARGTAGPGRGAGRPAAGRAAPGAAGRVALAAFARRAA